MGDHPKRKRINSLFLKWWHTVLLGKLPPSFCCFSLSFDNCIYCGRETDQPSLLFFLLSFCLSILPPTRLFLLNLKLWKITGQKRGENKVVHTHRGCGAIQAYLTSAYQNVWRVAWHFPGKMYSCIISVWISCQKRPTELCNRYKVWASPHYRDPSGATFQPDILGHRKEKKYRILEKILTRSGVSSETD